MSDQSRVWLDHRSASQFVKTGQPLDQYGWLSNLRFVRPPQSVAGQLSFGLGEQGL